MQYTYHTDRPEEFSWVDMGVGVKIVGYRGDLTFLALPEALGGKPVIAIGTDNAGYNRRTCHVLIPSTVRYAEPECFGGLLGNRYSSESAAWFSGFELAEGHPWLKQEGNYLLSADGTALYAAFGISDHAIRIPEGVRVIGRSAFSLLSETVKEVVLPSSLEIVEDNAFSGLSFLCSVTFPEGTKVLGTCIFDVLPGSWRSSGLVRANLPKTLEQLGGGECLIPLGLEENPHFRVQEDFILSADGKQLARYTDDLDADEVVIPEGVEEILPYAFAGYERIKKLTLPASLRYIRQNAFCANKVKTLRVGAALEDIEEAGWDFSCLNSILVDKKNPYLYTDKTCLYKRLPEGRLELICCFRNKIELYEAAEGTVRIRPDAFAHCELLTSLTLPESMHGFMGTSQISGTFARSHQLLSAYNESPRVPGDEPCFLVEEGLVYRRTGEGLLLLEGCCDSELLAPREGTVAIAPNALEGTFTTLVCPSSLRRIGREAFCSYGSKLTRVQFNEGLESIGESAFRQTKLRAVSLPASLRFVAASAFDETPVEAFEVAPGNPFYRAKNGALYSADKTVLYRVPPMGAYSEFAVPSTVKDIRIAFHDCEKIETIRLPDGIEVLGTCAVAGCKKLKHLYIGEGLQYADESFIDFDFPITIHSASADALDGFVRSVAVLQGAKLQFEIRGMEDLSKLSHDFALNKNPTGLTILRQLTNEKDVVIPETLGDHKVTQIGPRAFSRYDSLLESIRLPDTVTQIGEHAFESCRELRLLDLGSGVKTIGKAAFIYCSHLESLVIPEGVEELPDSLLFGCQKLSFVQIPASVTKISSLLFSDTNGGYRNLYLNRKCIYQAAPGSYAETFLKGYDTSQTYARGAEPLNVVSQRPKVPVVSEGDANYLRYLDHVLLEDGTVAVSFKQEQPKGLTLGILPETLMGLTVSTLTGVIPENISVLRIPRSVVRLDGVIGRHLPEGDTYLQAVEVAQDHPCFWTDGSAIYSKDRTELIFFANRQAESYTIHPDCLTIGPSAFARLPKLRKLVLSEKLVSIRINAFTRTELEIIEGIERISDVNIETLRNTPWYQNRQEVYLGSCLAKCSIVDRPSYTVREGTTQIAPSAFQRSIDWSNPQPDALEEIIIPDSVTVIGSHAFASRQKLKSVRLPEGLKKLENRLFSDNCSLKTLHIPRSLQQIDPDAMPIPRSSWNALTSAALESITVEEGNLSFKSENGVLYTADGGTLVCLPPSYPAASFTVPEGVHTVAPYACRGAAKLISLTLPHSLQTLGQGAFENCAALENVTMPSLVTMGKEAFCQCKALKRLTLPEGLQTVEGKALAHTGLTQIVLPKTVKTVGESALAHCPDITVYDTIDPEVKPLSQPSSRDDPKASVPAMIFRNKPMSGWNNCLITVCSGESGEIQFILPCYAQDNQYDYHRVLKAWGGHGEFDFAGLDAFFSEIKGAPNKLKAAVYRLRWPVNLTDQARDAYIAYLCKSAKELVKGCIDAGDAQTLTFCAPFGILKKNNIAELIEYATKAGAVEISAFLMAYQNEHFAPKKGGARMPGLSMKAAPLWAAPKTGTNKIGRYKGENSLVEFPTHYNDTPISGIADTTGKTPENYKNIVEVVLPEGYNSIGNYAFCGCEKLEKITLPSTLQTIGRYAFWGCTSLKEIVLPDSVTFVDQGAFRGCGSLTNVTLSASMRILASEVFYECKSLTRLHLPAGIRVLCKDSLHLCSALTQIFYYGTELQSDGAPFWNVPEIHVYPGTTVKVYGVRKKDIHYMGEDAKEGPRVQYSQVDAIEFAGRIFVLSGFSKTEEERLTQIITDKGGEVKSSLVVKTDYLILNENYGGITTKYTKALELNAKGKSIQILSAASFEALSK